MRIQVWHIVVIFSTLLLVSGCVDPPIDLRTRPAAQDETLVSGEPCMPPCWYGIFPEETRTQDAINTVTNLSFVNPDSVEETTRDLYVNTDNSILWRYIGTSSFGGNLSIRNGIVIWWQIDYPKFLKLKDIVSVIGEPDFVWAGRVGGAGTEHIYRFYFSHRGLLLQSRMYGADTRKDGKVLLGPDIEIANSRYFSPQILEGYLVNIVGASNKQAVRIKGFYQPWPGFGEWIEMQPEY